MYSWKHTVSSCWSQKMLLNALKTDTWSEIRTEIKRLGCRLLRHFELQVSWWRCVNKERLSDVWPAYVSLWTATVSQPLALIGSETDPLKVKWPQQSPHHEGQRKDKTDRQWNPYRNQTYYIYCPILVAVPYMLTIRQYTLLVCTFSGNMTIYTFLTYIKSW